MFDFFIVCLLVIILYTHIRFHLKKNNELVVHDIRKPTKNDFERICDYMQPVKVRMGDELSKISQLFTGTIHIRNVKKTPSYVSVDSETADRIFDQDKEQRYISERNTKKGEGCDSFLRPPLCSFHQFDYLRGSKGTATPFRYEHFNRHYLYVSEGTVKIRVATPNTSDVVDVINDTELFEFRTDVDPWTNDSLFRTKEVTLLKGDLLYIPAYWWHSIKYTTSASRVYVFKYHTYASVSSVLPYLFS